MIQKAKNLWNAFLGGILSLLGFSSCVGPFAPVEYGCPHADYKLDVEVTGEGKPLRDIRVVFFNGPADEDSYSAVDTLYTNAQGKAVGEMNITILDQRMCVKFEDADGAENGAWQTDILDKSHLQIKQTAEGDGKWYEGKYTITAKTDLKKVQE